MSIRSCLCALVASAAVAAGCGGSAQPASPLAGPADLATDSPAAPASLALAAIAGGIERAVRMFDACDPDTFNAVLGPNGCTRSGGVTFEKFIDQLTKHQTINSWRFSPAVVTVKEGQTLVAINQGGEVHTFTEVEEFGGGIVQDLNNLTGLTTIAPECTQLTGADFIPPGGQSSETTDEAGVEKYQCCIHPWMQAEVRVTSK